MNKLKLYLSYVIDDIKEHQLLDISAQSAFFFILSFFPLLLILFMLVPLLPIDFQSLLFYAEQLIPQYLYENIIRDFSQYFNNINYSVISIGFVIALFSASSAVNILIKHLNSIYNYDKQIHTIKRRFFAILLIFILFILLIVFSVTVLVLNNLLSLLNIESNLILELISFLSYLFIPIFIFGLMCIIYLFSYPNNNKIKQHIPGALFISIISLGMFKLLNVYFLVFNYSNKYGLIGSFIVLALYFYCISFLIFLGAIINTGFMKLKLSNNNIEKINKKEN